VRTRIWLLLSIAVLLRALVPGEEALVWALLDDAALPIEDLNESAVAFVVATDGEHLLGAIGLEMFEDVGLLRSLVVRSSDRGAGLGGRLVEALEAHARGLGLRQLVLLTQTAAPFFASRDYHVIDRKSAPAPVLGSAEFRSICPASATCMTKYLDQE